MPAKQKITPRVTTKAKKPDKTNTISVPKWALTAILVFTCLLYTKAIFNGLTGLDDDFYITNNPALRDFSLNGIKTIVTSFYAGNYHPLTMLIYFIEFKLFELNPLPYHLLNVLLHLINVALVFKLTDRLSGKRITAVVVSLLFAIHPMHVESVAWVSELKDVSYALFYLLSLIVYLRFISSGFRLKDYFGVLLLFLASLLCKSAAVTLPVLLIVIDLYKGRKLSARLIWEKIPFFALSLLFGILAIVSQRQGGAYNGLMISYGTINSFFLFTSSLAFYFIWLIAPLKLSIFHYFPELSNGFLPLIYYASLPVVILIAWLNVKRSAYRKEIWFGIGFFLVTISVMLQIVSVGSALTSERYTYVSYIGLFYIAGQIISHFVETERHKNTAIGVFALFVIVFSFQTSYRIDIWKDDHTLFNDLIEKNPDFYYGYWLRGNVEKKEGNANEARNDYSKAIELNPTFEDSYYNRGIIYDALGDHKSAIEDYSHSIKLNPKQADSYNSRGWAYYESGDKAAAIADYKKALEIKPDDAEAYNNLGWAYEQAGNANAATEQYTKAIAAAPGFRKALLNRANLKDRTGDHASAILDYSSIIKMYSADDITYFLRGNAYMAINDLKSACADWQKARSLGNQYADGMLNKYCR